MPCPRGDSANLYCCDLLPGGFQPQASLRPTWAGTMPPSFTAMDNRPSAEPARQMLPTRPEDQEPGAFPQGQVDLRAKEGPCSEAQPGLESVTTLGDPFEGSCLTLGAAGNKQFGEQWPLDHTLSDTVRMTYSCSPSSCRFQPIERFQNRCDIIQTHQSSSRTLCPHTPAELVFCVFLEDADKNAHQNRAKDRSVLSMTVCRSML